MEKLKHDKYASATLHLAANGFTISHYLSCEDTRMFNLWMKLIAQVANRDAEINVDIDQENFEYDVNAKKKKII